MKNIILAIFLFTGFQLMAQTIVPVEQQMNYIRNYTQNGKYFKDVNNVFDKFLGNWKYQTSTDLIEIRIYKKENDNLSNYFEDNLYIRFKYTKNGLVIFNTLDNLNSTQDYFLSLGSLRITTNINKFHMLYLEPGIERGASNLWLDAEYFPNNGTPLLHWNVHYEPMLTTAIAPQMPLNMVFIKQP